VKRGEVWTLQDDGYASKARPVVVVQSDRHNAFDSIVLCLLTTYESAHISTRVFISADKGNGLRKNSFVMTEKLVTVAKNELGKRIGVVSVDEMNSISQQLAEVLGITADFGSENSP
jgi:mRNA interferase MazF